MKNKLYIGYDSDSSCYAVYDEKRKIIRGWQEGDDIIRVLKDIGKVIGIRFETVPISVDGDFTDKI